MNKKIIALAVMLIMAFVAMFSFAGCKPQKTEKEQFYTLQEAYDKGWLTVDDLKSIAYYNNGGRFYNEDIIGENYVPIPKNPEVLDEETVSKIRQGFFEKYIEPNNVEGSPFEDENITIDDVAIKVYYGTYNGCIAVKMEDNYGCYGMWITIAANVIFVHAGNYEILIWK